MNKKPGKYKYIADDPIEIGVFAGLCTLRFQPGTYCGFGDTSPGVGFSAITPYVGRPRDGIWTIGSGVISRSDAARLRDALDNLLQKCPPGP